MPAYLPLTPRRGDQVHPWWERDEEENLVPIPLGELAERYRSGDEELKPWPHYYDKHAGMHVPVEDPGGAQQTRNRLRIMDPRVGMTPERLNALSPADQKIMWSRYGRYPSEQDVGGDALSNAPIVKPSDSALYGKTGWGKNPYTGEQSDLLFDALGGVDESVGDVIGLGEPFSKRWVRDVGGPTLDFYEDKFEAPIRDATLGQFGEAGMNTLGIGTPEENQAWRTEMYHNPTLTQAIAGDPFSLMTGPTMLFKSGRLLNRARGLSRVLGSSVDDTAKFMKLHGPPPKPLANPGSPGLGQRAMNLFRSSGTPMDPGRRRILAGGLGATLAGVGRGVSRSPVDIADLDPNALADVLKARWTGNRPGPPVSGGTSRIAAGPWTPGGYQLDNIGEPERLRRIIASTDEAELPPGFLTASDPGQGVNMAHQLEQAQTPVLAPWNRAAVAEDLKIAEGSLTGRGKGLTLDPFEGGAHRRDLNIEDLTRPSGEPGPMQLGQHHAPLTEESLSEVLGRVVGSGAQDSYREVGRRELLALQDELAGVENAARRLPEHFRDPRVGQLGLTREDFRSNMKTLLERRRLLKQNISRMEGALVEGPHVNLRDTAGRVQVSMVDDHWTNAQPARGFSRQKHKRYADAHALVAGQRKDLRESVGIMGESLLERGSDVFSQPLVDHYNKLYRQAHAESLKIVAGDFNITQKWARLSQNVRRTGMPMEPNLAAQVADDFARHLSRNVKDPEKAKAAMSKLYHETFEDLTMGTVQ